jgi:hypothetical protein
MLFGAATTIECDAMQEYKCMTAKEVCEMSCLARQSGVDSCLNLDDESCVYQCGCVEDYFM